MTDWIGKPLGNYRLLRLLGEGAFAEVYLGEHRYLQRQAAIKVLQMELASLEAAHFWAEARTIARLVHPHIIRLLEFGVEEETPFLAMEYAPGGTLRQRHPKGTRLAPATILPYVHAVAEALGYAHSRRLVHRDVKPENMLLGRDGGVLLGDFGVATLVHGTGSAEFEEIAGTVAYMAPEQIQGHPGPESDQYGLAITIYEWLTGAPPFRGSFPEVAVRHALVAPPPLGEQVPTLSASVEQVVLKALAKDPRERFEHTRAFATAFEQACQGAALLSAPTQAIMPSGPIGQPGAAITTPTPKPAFTIDVSPAHAPLKPALPSTAKEYAGYDAPAIPSRYSGWKDAPRSASSTPGARPIASRSPALVSIAGASDSPVKVPSQPKQHRTRRIIIVGSLILILAIIAGGINRVPHSPTNSRNILTRSPTNAHNEAPPVEIPSIQTGTGVDPHSGILLGKKTLFHVGDTVYVQFSDTGSQEVDLDLSLLQGYGFEAILSISIDTGPDPGSNQATFTNHTTVTSPGPYKWEVDYNGTAEASITFQVLS